MSKTNRLPFQIASQNRGRWQSRVGWVASALVVIAWTSPLWGQPALDDFEVQASWELVDTETVKTALRQWLAEHSIPVELRAEVERTIDALRDSETPRPRLNWLGEVLAMIDPDWASVMKSLTERADDDPLPDVVAELDELSSRPVIGNHARLWAGRWLVQHEFYDEAVVVMQDLGPAEVWDPASLLFYRGIAEHQLLEAAACQATLNRLLEHEDSLPRRYAVVTRMMLADLEKFEADSLDEISRIMADIRRRTQLNRSGRTVLDQESEVIGKLDQMISRLESQQQDQAQSQPAPGAQPMQDSLPASDRGDGGVRRREWSDGGSWGNLPAAERAAALAELTRQLPPHYRTAIEAYFRQLAEERDGR